MVEEMIIENATPSDTEAVARLLALQLLEHHIDFRENVLLSTIKS